MVKSVLLIGTSFSAVPIYSALKQLGCHVAVCGKVPSDPCHTFADESLDIDYSDRKQLLELVRKKKYQYIVPSRARRATGIRQLRYHINFAQQKRISEIRRQERIPNPESKLDP
jgi:formate-dependent phosphoribosylglycinamide formyltransferase (GAR transformylase)